MSGDRQLKQGKNGRGEHKDHRKDIFRGILTGKETKIEKGGQFDRKFTFFVYCRQNIVNQCIYLNMIQ